MACCGRYATEYCGTVNGVQLNTVELWTECNRILWWCERSATEYCVTVNGVQLNTVELWTECSWILWNCERSATEYCGTVNVMKLVTSPLPSLCVWPQGIRDSSFLFLSLSWTELSIRPRKKQTKKRNHFRPLLLYWSRPYGVRVAQ